MAAEPQFHVLAVDDSLIDRKLIERLLKTSSYQVTTVDSGSKALEVLGLQEEDEQREINQNQPSISPHTHQEVEVNLIITDYCMPGMTGYDLLKKVKESSAFRNIPVVIMSSENVPSRINRCLEDGAEEFFLKPVRLSDVNRLRPHMLRAKYGEQRQDLLHECQKPDPKQQQQCEQQLKPKPQPEPKPEQQQRQQYEQHPEPKPERQQQPEPKQEQQQQCEQQPEPKPEQQQQQNNNKRKSMDEGLIPDRTRPRYNGITTMV